MSAEAESPLSGRPLDQVDRALYRLEQRATAVLLLLMAAAVFADVVHRVFAREPGRISVLAHDLLGLPLQLMESWGSPLVILLGLWLAAYGALRARALSKGRALPAGRAAWQGALAVLVASLMVQAMLRLLPQGLVGAPYFALSLFLWVGLLGASMATHSQRHLALEMGEKIWPRAMRPRIRRLAQLLTAAFTLLVALLGGMSLAEHLGVWLDTPTADLIPSIDLPKWTVFWIIPYAFGVMSLRLLLRVFGLLSAPEPASELDLPGAEPEGSGR